MDHHIKENNPADIIGEESLTLDKFTNMYLDWVNNFLTVERFAEHYGISYADAQFIIETGRAISHRQITKVLY